MESELESLLTCSVCLEICHKPHVLKCLHTYCYGCVEGLDKKGKVTCPNCREVTATQDIKPDFKTQTLIDLRDKNSQEKTTLGIEGSNSSSKCEAGAKLCDICEDRNKVAECKCTICEQFLCSDCERAHSRLTITKDHMLVSIDQVMSELTDKLEQTRQELVKNKQLIGLHSQGSEAVIGEIRAEARGVIERVRGEEEEYVRQVRAHHAWLVTLIEDKANSLVSELQGYVTRNNEVEAEIDKRVSYVGAKTYSTTRTMGLQEMSEIATGVGPSLAEEVEKYKSALPDLKKLLKVKVIQGYKLDPNHMTKVQISQGLVREEMERSNLPARISNLVSGCEYKVTNTVIHQWSLAMKVEVYDNNLWSAAYNDGVYVYDLEGNVLQQIRHKFISCACGVVRAFNGDTIVACAEHHDLLRFGPDLQYMGRITQGSFSDVCTFRDQVFSLDYDRGMILVFDFNPNSTKWFCIKHWKIEGYSYGHYCDKIKVTEGGIYIGSYSDHCVYILTHTGQIRGKIGQAGNGQLPGMFSGLVLCDVDERGNVLVCDRVSHNLQVYSEENKAWRMVILKGERLGQGPVMFPTDVAVNGTGDIIWVVTNQRELIKLQASN